MKKILSLILILAFSVPQTAALASAAYDWSASSIYITYDGRGMPFSPPDRYVSEQNPPSFTWPYARPYDSNRSVTYELKVCTDPALDNVSYSRTGLADNYYAFSYTFDTGVDYYWSVRYCVGDSFYSAWSPALRFRIDPAASVFTIPAIDQVMHRLPAEHPRIWTTRDGLEEFRSYKDQNDYARRVFKTALGRVQSYLQAGTIPEEPVEFGAAALSAATKMTTMIQNCAFVYLINGDAATGDFAVRLLEAVSKWSWDDAAGPTSYKGHDQAHRDISYKSAMAYDWLYDLFQQDHNAAAKESVLRMIKARTGRMAEDLLVPLKKCPYDSHGWTTLGYIGIVGAAMCGEFPEAEQWLKQVIPLYTAVLPPWSIQDGGWSQGTDYWQYSAQMGGEFMDVLALAGMVNLYDTAWMQNQHLWSLYAYPAGSYGSFGDQSGQSKAEDYNYTAQSMSASASFTGNSLTKWIAEQTGGMPTDVLSSYYVSSKYDIDAQPPDGYPLSHAFKDIGLSLIHI